MLIKTIFLKENLKRKERLIVKEKKKLAILITKKSRLSQQTDKK